MLHSTPRTDGFFMPAEYAPHRGTLMIWPTRPGSWGKDPHEAQEAFLRIFEALSPTETVYVLTDEAHKAELHAALSHLNGVQAPLIPTDDAWARDVGPTFVIDGKGGLRGVNWRFNAWGGTYDGLYADWEADDLAASRFCSYLEVPCYDASPFVLEGGSIHCDGEGTVMVTESCLLSPGRNPDLSREQIEETLKDYLGAEKVLWLPRGIYNDETNEHVDNVCAFLRPAEVVLAWTDNEEDPQYPLSRASLDYLNSVTDAKGRPITVHKLPIPDHPILCSEEDCAAYEFEEGEDVRTPGERLAASYVNFYFGNGILLLPFFGGENTSSDRRAAALLSRLCPDRKVIGIPARAILQGGGNIHCITQQIPL